MNQYRAERHEDGTFTIYGVPVFSEVPAGAKQNEKPIDRAWMQRAVDAAAKLEKENGYLPPLHIGHHKREGANVQPAGHFRLRSVERMKLDGAEKNVLVADLVKVPEGVFEEIKAGKYPYRSVEVIKWDEGRLNHLALLSHEEPFFKFPLLNGDTLTVETKELSAFSFVRDADGIAAVFKEDPMFKSRKQPDEKKQPKTVEERLTALEDGIGQILERFDAFTGEDEGAEFSVEDVLTEAEEVLDSLEGVEFANEDEREEVGAALAELDECLAGIEAECSEGEEGGEEEESADLQAPSTADPGSMKKLARVEGRVAALENERVVAALVNDATELLESKGFHLNGKTEEKIVYFANMGEDALTNFVESYIESAQPDPKALEDAETKDFASDPVVAELKLSPEDAEIAFALAQEYDSDVAKGVRSRVSKKDYIACNIEARRAQMTA